MKDLLKDCKIMVIQDPLASGSTTNSLGSATVDMRAGGGIGAGFDNCLFIATVGATTTRVELAAQASTSTTAADFATITGATAGTTASNAALAVNVLGVTQRYLRTTLNSTGANVNGSTIAILYGAHSAPTTNASTDVAIEVDVVST